MENKTRVIQEYVPGKQVTLAHVISNASEELCVKIGMPPGTKGAIGILTLTPSETAIIAGDIATKTANVNIVFVDRFSGSLVITGDNSSCFEAVRQIVSFIGGTLGFDCTEITCS